MTMPTVEEFTEKAEAWLEANARLRTPDDAEPEFVWGQGSFAVPVFHNLGFDEEQAHLRALQAWQQKKATEGYHAIAWDERFGGLGLTRAHARAFGRLERNYVVPDSHELFSVTVGLIATTIREWGTEEQQNDWIPGLLRTDDLSCQLFSEPGAGSDLASLGCKAERDGDEWRITGQKVWTSGAQFSATGLLLARSELDAPKHKGITAFIIPFDIPGVEVRQIRQASGGTSFNEVFFDNAIVPDSCRLGPEGAGWKVALTTLGFERDHSASGGSGAASGGNWEKLLATAQAFDRVDDPIVRDDLTRMYTFLTVQRLLNRRAADLARSGTPGPEGSLGKLMWTEGMTMMSGVVSRILGPRLIADSGEWGSYEWGEHVLGAPGYRIAGGSDEIQRNIIGERVLGLPGEPRVDKNTPWRDLPR